jgi:hypothetical protein
MSEPAARIAKPLRIVLRPGNRRAMLEAQAGRQSGLRACSELVDHLQDRLAKSADRIEQLNHELTRERIKHRLAQALLRRFEAIDAQHERADGVTMH